MFKSTKPRGRGVGVRCIAGLCAAVAVLLLGLTVPSAAQQAVAHAFAKASPLSVFDDAGLTKGRSEAFDFGVAYEVVEQSPEYARLKLKSGKLAYVRLAHVTVVNVPSWINSSDNFKRSERARIRFWESSTKLNDFLSGINTAGARWDFEEYFETAPNFSLRLPVVGLDTLDLLGGDRQVRIASVMLPISKQMHDTFENAKTGGDRKLDLYFVLDISNSTKGFLDAALSDFAKMAARNDTLKERIRSVALAYFASGYAQKTSAVGDVALKDLQTANWRALGAEKAERGDREPLLDGIASAMRKAKRDGGAVPTLVVLSGAEVDSSGHVAALGKSVSADNLDLNVPENSVGVFAQVTPEPGDALRTVSQKLRNVASARYIEYSETLGADLVQELVRAAEGRRDADLDPKQFAAVATAAHQQKMLAILPRVLRQTSTLPSRQNYALNADWYTVRLWVTLDNLIMSEIKR